MLRTSGTNQSQCEHCGNTPADQYIRNDYARHSGGGYVKARHNRMRLEWIPERLQALYGDRVGQLLCQTCYDEVMQAINKPGN